MELKEARYILAIAKHQSIGKAAESLYISQPSLSKYLKNLEERLGAPLFDRRENHYYPTYMGERYLYYAERIAAFGDQWSQEFDDIAHQEKGRLNIAAPIMMGTTLIDAFMYKSGHVYAAMIGHITANAFAVIRTETGILKWTVDGSVMAWVVSVMCLGVGAVIFYYYAKHTEGTV